MKKIINDPKNVVDEMVDGLVRAYPQYLTKLPDTEAMVRSDQDSMQGKVGIVSGGGSGHEPAHAGFVGPGMLSAAVAGQVFTSPTPDQIYAAIKAVDQGKGVFLVVKNYSGDVMNFDMAKDMAELDNIQVKSIVVDDDIAVKDSLYTQGRRGVAGTIFMHKILGAAADQGVDLDDLESLATHVLPRIKTIAVALSAATVPEVGKPGFELADDEIEFGVGIHSEPGYRREKIKPSKQLVQELLGKLDDELHLQSDHQYAFLVNGMGATPLMDQYVFCHDLLDELATRHIQPAFMKVGNYMTSIDMAGISLTIFDVAESQWLVQATAMALISKVGGASGPLYGTAFLEMAKQSKIDSDLGGLLAAALAGIEKRGGATTGDKTLIDVWAPVVQAVQAGELTQDVIDDAVASTEPMVAKKGRASYLGERSVGHLDPGAVSSGYLFTTLLDTEGIL